MNSAYEPMEPARRPGGKPEEKPCYRCWSIENMSQLGSRLLNVLEFNRHNNFGSCCQNSRNEGPYRKYSPSKGKGGSSQGERVFEDHTL